MSDFIPAAERHLLMCIASMQEILNAIDDAFPHSLPLFVKKEEERATIVKEIKSNGSTSERGDPIKEIRDASELLSSPTKWERDDSGDGAYSEGSSAVLPETLLQQLEWEHKIEVDRLSPPVATLKQRMHQLKMAIAALGGGIDAQQRILDIPTSVLDQDIEIFSRENVRLGDVLLAKYEEAEMLGSTMEEKVMRAVLPPSL